MKIIQNLILYNFRLYVPLEFSLFLELSTYPSGISVMLPSSSFTICACSDPLLFEILHKFSHPLNRTLDLHHVRRDFGICCFASNSRIDSDASANWFIGFER